MENSPLLFLPICIAEQAVLLPYLVTNCNNQVFWKFGATKAVRALLHACSKMLMLTDCLFPLPSLFLAASLALCRFGNKHIIQSVVLSIRFF